jgi:hypothetical protein
MKDTLLMPLTKYQIINAIAEQNGFTRTKSSETVETILEIIKSTLASDEDVLISLVNFKKGTDEFSSLINITVKANQKGVCNETY